MQNGTGAPLNKWYAAWAFTILERVDILAENGSTVLESILPDHLLRAWYRLDSARYRAVSNGLTADYAGTYVDEAEPA